ncbi:MAG TPA: PfkB family carbohydrate kinase [Actinomycetaceae bacterium]|nr:PfkB family carbohydrate kinase [Actinomycetaceae bacterium]
MIVDPSAPGTATPILVVGEALIDIVIHDGGSGPAGGRVGGGAPTERSGSGPAGGQVGGGAPTERSGSGPVEHVGGSPANVAKGLARLGHPVTLATHIGDDDRGRRIAAELQLDGVIVTPGSTTAERTPTATAHLDEHGKATYEFDLAWQVEDGIGAQEGGHLHTGSIAATLQPGGSDVLALAAGARGRATVSYDPNARPAIMGSPTDARAVVERLVAKSDLVKVSDEDIEWLYGVPGFRDVVEEWHAMGPPLIVVTLGSEGAFVSCGGETETLPSAEVTVADTVGAGDSFMAGLLSGLLDAGLLGGVEARDRLAAASLDDVRPAVQRALTSAGITVSRAGANPPTRAELG